MTKELLPLHCDHDVPVTKRCEKCEMDAMLDRGTGFTPPREQAPSNEWSTPWRASGLAVYDAQGTLVAHTGITGNRSMRGEQLERMASMIAEAVTAYSAGEPPAEPIGFVARRKSDGYVCSQFARPGFRTEIAEGFEWVPVFDRSSPPPAVWQPIETAPKDGTMILTVVMGYQPGIYKWFQFEDGGGRWTPDPECFLEEAHFREWIDGNSYDPTHWMPIPKGPTATKGEG